MRRAKIKPSINLAASRRPVRTAAVSSKDADKTVPKSPAKNVRATSASVSFSEKSVPKSPAKGVRPTLPTDSNKTVPKSPVRSVQQTVSSTEADKPADVVLSAAVGTDVTENVSVEKQGAVESLVGVCPSQPIWIS